MSEAKRVREMEGLIELQANAITALQQAAQALQIALQALEKAMADKGDQQKIVFVPAPPTNNLNPISPYNPGYYSTWGSNTGQAWCNSGSLGNMVGGLCATITNTAKSVNNLCGYHPIAGKND
jgi:hypothetical protein